MTQEQAIFVKHYRIMEEYSWRSIAEVFYDKFKSFPFAVHPSDDEIRYTTQQHGRQLCVEASIVLNETID